MNQPTPDASESTPDVSESELAGEPARGKVSPAEEGPASPTLAVALARQHIELPPEQIDMLERYCRLLWDWNEKLNLTRHTNYEKFVARDVVDSLVIARSLEQGECVLDIGTGGGVPGVVLHVLRPDLQVHLSESVGKKARAVQDIVKKLAMPLRVHACRAEDLLGHHAYTSLIARAVAPLQKLLTWLHPHWGAFDRLLAIKGPAWVDERQESRRLHLLDRLQLRKLATWPLPGTHSESVLLEIRPTEAS